MKFGLLGHGSIGRRHAANLRALGHDVVVYDPAERLDFGYERQLYDSNVDGVIIASPTRFHEAAIRACVERHKPMFVEKPIAVTIGSIPALLQCADESKIPVMMGNMLRFDGRVDLAKSAVAGNSYGDVRWATFTCAVELTPTARADGVLLNVGSHEVDLALYLLGPAKYLCGAIDRHRADFVLEHDSGVRSTFHLDVMSSSSSRVRECRIGCDRYPVKINLDAPDVYAMTYVAEMDAFVRLVKGEKPQEIATGHDGLRTLELLQQIGHGGATQQLVPDSDSASRFRLAPQVSNGHRESEA